MNELNARINASLRELEGLLACDNIIDLPYLRRDGFLLEMWDIITTELNADTFNYAAEVLHMIYKKKMGEHRLWLDTFELMVRDTMFLSEKD